MSGNVNQRGSGKVAKLTRWCGNVRKRVYVCPVTNAVRLDSALVDKFIIGLSYASEANTP